MCLDEVHTLQLISRVPVTDWILHLPSINMFNISSKRGLGLLFLLHLTLVNGHGYMTSPRPRNWVAAQDGATSTNQEGVRGKEYCYHCLNRNNGVCGIGNAGDYDANLDSTGKKVMPWISQGSYTAGEIITVKFSMSTHHAGHVVLRGCADGPTSTFDCFDRPENELTFVKDVKYGMPKDEQYPGRGYMA